MIGEKLGSWLKIDREPAAIGNEDAG